MKKIMTLIVMLVALCLSAQTVREYEFGKPTTQELALTTYPKDPYANAVILYEKGSYKFQEEYEHSLTYIKLFETVYRKIKILSEDEKEKHSTVSIYIRGNNRDSERITAIRAVTTNPAGQTHVQQSQIFTKSLPNNYYEITFTFPNVQKGSILEFEYTVSSTNYMRLSDWYFQHNIPTMYSEFYAEIPGFYSYTRSLLGNHPLAVNQADIKKYCFYFNNNKNNAECEVITYTMKDVPALVEEDFMLSARNYSSRINFELERVINQDGSRRLYAKDWKTVEQDFRSRKNIGQQLNNESFFKGNLPSEILSIGNKTDRAKAVYRFIQNHFNQNNDGYSIFYENDVRKAFNSKTGNAAEINMALVNALNAAGIDAFLSLSATRQKGLPIKDMAVINDFNYAMAFAKIDGTNYFMDASDKFLDFGMVPYHALNYYARIMDFKKGGYWEDIVINTANNQGTTVQIKVNDNYDFEGKLRETNTGYFAVLKREELSEIDRENYLRKKESGVVDLEIIDYSITDRNDNSKPIVENFEFILAGDKDANIIFNPFIISDHFDKNPFNLSERNYPIDFGFTRRHTYMLSMDLGDKYTIENLPESNTYRVGENTGEVSVNYGFTNGLLQIRFNFQLNQVHFTAGSYQGLKEFFGHLVQIQNNSPVILKKI